MFGEAGPFVRFLQFASIGYYGWLDVRERLGVERFCSPVSELHLFQSYKQVDRAVELLHLGQPLACTERVSKRPVHDGYIAVLELTASPEGEDAEARVRAFVEREARREVEPYLRACYGDDPAAQKHEALQFMDYPGFDTGNADPGFGLMVDGWRSTRWLWSRVVFAHK